MKTVKEVIEEAKLVKAWTNVTIKTQEELEEATRIADVKGEEAAELFLLDKIARRIQEKVETSKGIKKDKKTALLEFWEAYVQEEPKKEPVKKSPSHQIGDLHKNGLWIWSEYRPGRFDWRVIPAKKKVPGAKPKVVNTEDKAEVQV